MWLKKCEAVRHRLNRWDWGDGAFVSGDGKKCSVQTGAARQALRAKVGWTSLPKPFSISLAEITT